jgi:hypothetical protein
VACFYPTRIFSTWSASTPAPSPSVEPLSPGRRLSRVTPWLAGASPGSGSAGAGATTVVPAVPFARPRQGDPRKAKTPAAQRPPPPYARLYFLGAIQAKILEPDSLASRVPSHVSTLGIEPGTLPRRLLRDCPEPRQARPPICSRPYHKVDRGQRIVEHPDITEGACRSREGVRSRSS